MASDENLIPALKRDDRSAINTIFLKHHAMLCRISFRIINDPDEAKDIVQDVFIKLWQKRQELNIHYSLEAYLKKAVVNTSLNRIESKRKFVSLHSSESTVQASENVVEGQQSINELSTSVDHAIASLPVRTKAVFTLIRFEEMTYKEVAESLEISTKAVEKEMMKALKLLREALKDYIPLLIFAISGAILISLGSSY